MSDKLFSGVKAGSTDVSIPVLLRTAATSVETTGVAHGSVTASYWRQGGSRTAISMTNLSSVTDAHSDGGWEEVDGTNMPGVYRFDIPDAAFATGADWVVVSVKVASSFVYHVMFPLSTDVIQTGDSFARIGSTGSGLTTLATAAAVATIDTIVDKFDTMVVLDGAVYQFTANALELGPTTAYGGPTVTQIRQEMDNNSTKLANLDAAVTTRMATFTVPGSFATANFAVLSNLDATVSSRLASASFTQRSEPPSAATIATAVWDKDISGYNTANGFAGYYAKNTNSWAQAIYAFVDSQFQMLAGAVISDNDSLQEILDKLNTMLAADGANWKFTGNALQEVTITGGGTATLENQLAILGALTTANVTVVSPVSANGTILNLIEGDSYQTADGRQLDFSGVDWPSLTGGSFNFKVASAGLTVAASVTSASSLRVQLSAANTTALSPGKTTFHIDGTLSNGNPVTLVIGSLFVTENQ